jgi:hypothetical protein
VRLRNVSDLQYVGTSERLIDDSSAHGRASSSSDGTWCHHYTR